MNKIVFIIFVLLLQVSLNIARRTVTIPSGTKTSTAQPSATSSNTNSNQPRRSNVANCNTVDRYISQQMSDKRHRNVIDFLNSADATLCPVTNAKATKWIGRKLEKEIMENEPDFDDLFEYLEWLDLNGALPFVYPDLIADAYHMMNFTIQNEIVAVTEHGNRDHRIPMVWILGRPGSGKSTMSDLLHDYCKVISVGDEARLKPSRKSVRYQQQGLAEEADYTVDLLEDSLLKRPQPSCAVIDGFPRTLLHLHEYYDENLHGSYKLVAVIHLNITEAISTQRVNKRSQAAWVKTRLDDHVVDERNNFYDTYTEDVLTLVKDNGLLIDIDATQDINSVQTTFLDVFRELAILN